MTKTLVVVAVVAALGLARAAGAQDARVYVGGAGMVSTQGSHRQGSSPSLPIAGAGGTTIGVVVEAGRLVTPHVALGVEVSLPRRFTSLQETDYLRVFQQESHHSDTAISGLLRGVAGSGRVRLGLVGGGGVVRESTQQRRRDQIGLLPTFPPVFGPYSEEETFARWTVSALAGAEVAIAVTSHIAVVPHMRVHVVRRSTDPSQQGWALGLSTVVLRPAIGVRATF